MNIRFSARDMETAAHIYRTTENEAVRGQMEATLEFMLREKSEQRERKCRQEIRELQVCLALARRDYANHHSELVRRKSEAALPRLYRKLLGMGVDPQCMVS